MNSLERVSATLRNQPADRVPVIPQVFGHAAVLAGVHLGDYLRDGSLLARCQIAALKRYQYDAIFALMDTSVETEAAGSVLRYSQGGYPTVRSHILSKYEGGDLPPEPDPHSDGRMPELLRAAGILREEVGDEVLVVGCVLGPLTIATQLMGLQEALFCAIDETDRFTEILDYATGISEIFGLAQIEAGVHLPLVFDPSGIPGGSTTRFLQGVRAPPAQEIFTEFASHGSAANWLHIAGPSAPIFPLFPQAGVDIANFDYLVSVSEAQKALPDTCLDGNINPLSFVDADPGEISRIASEICSRFISRRNFILSSGCEIPPESRSENIEAMVRAAQQSE